MIEIITAMTEHPGARRSTLTAVAHMEATRSEEEEHLSHASVLYSEGA